MNILDYLHKASVDESKSPLLALGVFERVGSNWFLDSVSRISSIHNEPYRQQVGDTHPASSMTYDFHNLSDMPVANTTPYELHWFREFYQAKYGEKRQVIKETNLFFALSNLVGIFPKSPMVILSRHPFGILDSFKKRNLYRNWLYDKRYKQIRHIVGQHKYKEYYTDDEYGDPLSQLAYLIGLQAIIIARLTPADTPIICYESDDNERAIAMSYVYKILDAATDMAYHNSQENHPRETVNESNIFTTTQSRTVTSRRSTSLSEADAHTVRHVIDTLFRKIEENIGSDIVARAHEILFKYDAVYSFHKDHDKITCEPQLYKQLSPEKHSYSKSKTQDLYLRDTLVTNEEFCTFLNTMRKNGITNIVGGLNLFFDENMPNHRGGRITFSKENDCYGVQVGYEQHPVYWITWIGAQTYAIYAKSALPKRAELLTEYDTEITDLQTVNVDYRNGDVIPHDTSIAGNLRRWCVDGPSHRLYYYSGLAWNTPATRDELYRDNYRSETGCSRSIGIQLVRHKVTDTLEDLYDVDAAKLYIKEYQDRIAQEVL